MGYHFANPNLFGTVDRREPQILAYGVEDGELVLGAVEYLVPKAGEYAENPPDLFDHDDGAEQWGTLPAGEFPFDLWAMHVWVHVENPNGVFYPINPKGMFSPNQCEGIGGHD